MTGRRSSLPAVDRVTAGKALLRPGESGAVSSVTLDVDAGTGTLAPTTSPGESRCIGGSGCLVLPALADAHDHCRGLAPVAYGAADQALELWVPALVRQPWIDPELLAGLALAKLARSGVGAVVHCHNPQRPHELVEEAAAVIQAARAVGLRLAFVVPLADRSHLGWNGSDLSVEAQLADADAVAAEMSGGLVSVQYGPVGPQWCSDSLLEEVAERSSRNSRRVHMHLLETRYQREWADATYPTGLVRRLDEIGLLSPRLTVAHGVWLTDDELELLAERGVLVSVNTSSNLRLKSGIARVRRMLELGVRVAIGLDGMSLDDDDDFLRELRLTQVLHAGVGLEDGVGPGDIMHAATAAGPAAVADGAWGALERGAPADLLVVDRASYGGDVIDGLVDERELLLVRCRARHVRELVVAGRVVVEAGRVVGVDEDDLGAEVAARCRAARPEVVTASENTRAHQAALKRFYEAGMHLTTGSSTAQVTAP